MDSFRSGQRLNGAILACGAWLKNTVCVAHRDEFCVSGLIGDLDSLEARLLLEKTIQSMCEGMPVLIVAHDLHPDFYSTQLALSFSARHGLPTLPVQHHHAHIAAVCAEHRYSEPLLGLALDGVGMGADGTAWGGELLRVFGADYLRLGHLALLPMPGADMAAREPWRMAAAALYCMGRGDEIALRFSDQPACRTVAQMLKKNLNCPSTSSMGRLFDAAAGLLGICPVQSFEAQAAVAMQKLAAEYGRVAPVAGGYHIDADHRLNFLPLLKVLADCDDPARGAAQFHATIAQGMAEWATIAARSQQLDCIALAGGCFFNEILLIDLSERLMNGGMRVLCSSAHGDSSISLGQAWVAAQHLYHRKPGTI